MHSRGQRGQVTFFVMALATASIPFTFACAASNDAFSGGGSAPDRALSSAMFSGSYTLNQRSAAGAGWRGAARQVVFSKNGSKGRRYAGAPGGLQCVPFARDASGIELVGNAWTWWERAMGVYERGNAPEPGSVLAFRSNGFMPLGHVAVVSRLVNDRVIEIDHANWRYRGRVARGVAVADVSPNNDWTAVRVALGEGDDFGSIYPTYGFIYGRPDRGGATVMAVRSPPAPQPELNPAPRDLRPSVEGADPGGYEEVAEAPSPGHKRKTRSHPR